MAAWVENAAVVTEPPALPRSAETTTSIDGAPAPGGGAGVTVTVAVALTLPDELVAVSVYVVVADGETTRDPDAATLPIP